MFNKVQSVFSGRAACKMTVLKRGLFNKFTSRKTLFQLKCPMFSRHANISNILGIETSCDDTGCGIVSTDGKLLGEGLFSQQKYHTEYV